MTTLYIAFFLQNSQSPQDLNIYIDNGFDNVVKRSFNYKFMYLRKI